MSHAECPGLSTRAPSGLAVAAGDEVEGGPEASAAACRGRRAATGTIEGSFSKAAPASLPSRAEGVPHPASPAIVERVDPRPWPSQYDRAAATASRLASPWSCSLHRGVGQPASDAAIPSVRPKPLPLMHFALISSRRSCQRLSLLPKSCASGVGHPEQPVAHVRRGLAISLGIRRPCAVRRRFHLC